MIRIPWQCLCHDVIESVWLTRLGESLFWFQKIFIFSNEGEVRLMQQNISKGADRLNHFLRRRGVVRVGSVWPGGTRLQRNTPLFSGQSVRICFDRLCSSPDSPFFVCVFFPLWAPALATVSTPLPSHSRSSCPLLRPPFAPPSPCSLRSSSPFLQSLLQTSF